MLKGKQMKKYLGLALLLLTLSFLFLPSVRFSGNASANQQDQSGRVTPSAVGAVLTVDTADDNNLGNCNVPGNCTLREAIALANELPGTDTIQFQIPGSTTINLESPLPTITGPLIIDGTTQPGFAGTPIVELNGEASDSFAGLEISADGTTIQGLVINRFSVGISIDADNCV